MCLHAICANLDLHSRLNCLSITVFDGFRNLAVKEVFGEWIFLKVGHGGCFISLSYFGNGVTWIS